MNENEYSMLFFSYIINGVFYPVFGWLNIAYTECEKHINRNIKWSIDFTQNVEKLSTVCTKHIFVVVVEKYTHLSIAWYIC